MYPYIPWHPIHHICWLVCFQNCLIFSLIGSRFSGVFAATAKSRPPHPACLHFMASTTSRGVVHHILPIISGSPESLDAHYLSYNNMPSYSYASNLSVHMHTINNSQRERSQSTHKVSKRRRIAPSWDVVDERPPHQLVHGDEGCTFVAFERHCSKTRAISQEHVGISKHQQPYFLFNSLFSLTTKKT